MSVILPLTTTKLIFTINISNVVLGPSPAVPQIRQSDTLLDGLLGLLECQLSSLETVNWILAVALRTLYLVLDGLPHDGKTEVNTHPGGHDVVSVGGALEVDEAEVRLPVLHPRHEDHVPQRVKLGPPIIQNPGQPAVQSL